MMKSNDQDNSMVPKDAENALDLLLIRELKQSSDYIDDQGFTARVMEKLPKQRKLSPWVEWLILVVPSLVVACFVLTQMEMISSVFVAVAVLKNLSVIQLILLVAVPSLMFLLGVVWWVTQEKN